MIDFRPHHLLCALGFIGKGYSPDFIQNFKEIVARLRNQKNGDQTPIQIVAQTDRICDPCPNRRQMLCTSEAKIQKLDNAHAEILRIRAGDSMSWGQAKTILAEKMTLEKFHNACAPCAWKSLGVCEKALVSLQLEFQSKKVKE